VRGEDKEGANEGSTTGTKHADAGNSLPSGAMSVDADEDEPADPPLPTAKLVVLNGLHRELVEALGASDLDIDPAFIECCAARRVYRPPRWLARRAQWRRSRSSRTVGVASGAGCVSRGCMWEYPELVEGLDPASVTVRTGDGEIATPPSVVSLPPPERGGKKLAVVFRQAALWRGKTAHVLFLDGPLWEVAEEGVRKATRQRAFSWRTRGGGERGTEADEDVTASLQDVLLAALCGGSGGFRDQLPGIISEAVYDRWLELFGFLEPPLEVGLSQPLAACYGRMIRSLEFNEDGGSAPDWTTSLLSRIQHRVALLSGASKMTPPSPPAASRITRTKMFDHPEQKLVSREDTMNPSLKSMASRRARGRPQRVDENQRALDRLSYLGDILVPLPIVSSILSMGDTYGPDGSKFYVFWAVAVPLAGLAVLLIYADTIRKAEVWVEIRADHVEPTPDTKSESSEGTLRLADVEMKQTTARRRQRRNEDDEAPSRRQHAVPFSIDHDVEERIIDLPTTSAPAAAHPFDEDARDAVRDWMPRSAGWSATGLVQMVPVPAVILEQPTDGSKPKAWRREQLGWGGAIRTILYKRFRVGSDVPAGVAACVKPARRKANSY
jgi:hypothetical protein